MNFANIISINVVSEPINKLGRRSTKINKKVNKNKWKIFKKVKFSKCLIPTRRSQRHPKLGVVVDLIVEPDNVTRWMSRGPWGGQGCVDVKLPKQRNRVCDVCANRTKLGKVRNSFDEAIQRIKSQAPPGRFMAQLFVHRVSHKTSSGPGRGLERQSAKRENGKRTKCVVLKSSCTECVAK